MTKKLFAAPVLLSALILGLTSCGNENVNSSLNVLESGKKLGKCNDKNVGEMVFVTDSSEVYYCADGKWNTLKGEDGEDGSSCSAKEVKDGLEISCGGEVVGTIKDGADGESCSTSDDGEGTVTVKCGSKTETLYKAICGAKPFDPQSKFCSSDSLYDRCDGKVYDLKTQYCMKLEKQEFVENLLIDDRDQRAYKTVKICDVDDSEKCQTWMAENMNYDVSSRSICAGGEEQETEDGGCGEYARLYATTAVASACPTGWKVPDMNDWKTLLSYIGAKELEVEEDSDDAEESEEGDDTEKSEVVEKLDGSIYLEIGNALKSRGWDSDSETMDGGVDVFGFNAIPAGIYNTSADEPMYNFGTETLFFVNTKNERGYYYYANLKAHSDSLVISSRATSFYASVRCLKRTR